MKAFLFFLVLRGVLLVATPGTAQGNSTGEISGQIFNNAQTPAAFATQENQLKNANGDAGAQK